MTAAWLNCGIKTYSLMMHFESYPLKNMAGYEFHISLFNKAELPLEGIFFALIFLPWEFLLIKNPREGN